MDRQERLPLVVHSAAVAAKNLTTRSDRIKLGLHTVDRSGGLILAAEMSGLN